MEIKKKIFLLAFCLGTLAMFGQNDLYHAAIFKKGADSLQYRILYPKDFSASKQYPVVLFLHGAGERGSDNQKQLVHGSKLFLEEENRENFPAIVLFPQCPQEDYWSRVAVDRTKGPLEISFEYSKGPTKALELTMALMDSLVQESYVKKDQLYIMGLSMGGMGTFEMLYRKPGMFAAAIPICGGGDLQASEIYANKVPLWIFHGAKDNVVNPHLSLDIAAKIIEFGGAPNLTIFGDANHNSWDPAFDEPNLLPWLFSVKRSE
ncbi:Alpha/beta hydrolase family protein [Arenibacter nanhaiticus]|uniref:Alpha/beta hydrolase family protein n=1 Tax=Arenibacter nanhaiticus TaxID=558155 RepID=A0A1M6IWG0_9FLAO|nr:prolyl oligopeptidase family serine peptidase [Arenibacter nanhaiticus]SHJ38747.1 Alpha/beta hydrolase family protein [Arenibacter nanhaiticus]